MEDHRCEQIANLKRIDKVIFGNGQLGLLKDVEKLKETTYHMNEHLDSLSTSYAALVQAQVEQDVIKKMKISSIDKKNRAIMQASAIIGAAGVIITAILTFG